MFFLVLSFTAALSAAFSNPVLTQDQSTKNDELGRQYDVTEGRNLGLYIPDELNGKYYRTLPTESYRDHLDGLYKLGDKENEDLWAFLNDAFNMYQILRSQRMITQTENLKEPKRNLDSIGGGHLLKRSQVLDPIGGGHLLKRAPILDPLGDGNLLKRGDRFWLKRSPVLDSLGGGHLLRKKILDSIGGGHLIKKGRLFYDDFDFEKRPTLDPIGGGHLLKRSEEQKTSIFTT